MFRFLSFLFKVVFHVYVPCIQYVTFVPLSFYQIIRFLTFEFNYSAFFLLFLMQLLSSVVFLKRCGVRMYSRSFACRSFKVAHSFNSSMAFTLLSYLYILIHFLPTLPYFQTLQVSSTMGITSAYLFFSVFYSATFVVLAFSALLINQSIVVIHNLSYQPSQIGKDPCERQWLVHKKSDAVHLEKTSNDDDRTTTV